MKTSDSFTFKSLSAGYQLEGCHFEVGFYDNLNYALMIVHPEDGPQCKCTLNNSDMRISHDLIHIKNYSENRGMKEFLKNLGIIKDFDNIPNEYSGYDIYPLTESGKELFKDLKIPNGTHLCNKGCVRIGNCTDTEADDCREQCKCDKCDNDIRELCYQKYIVENNTNAY